MKDRKFEQIYQYIKENYTEELERLRKKLVRYIIITLLLLPVASIMCGIVWAVTEIEALGFLVLGLFGMYAGSIWVKNNKRYQTKYKEDVIKNFIKTINNELSYENINNNKLEQYYKDAKFSNDKYDKFESNDYVRGCIISNANFNT